MRSSAFVLKCFFHVFVIVISLSLIRVALGGKPITFSYFLHCLSIVDFDFSNVLYSMAMIGKAFDFAGDINFWNAVVKVLQAVYNILTLPVSLFLDIVYFVVSVFDFLIALLGFNYFAGFPGKL